jgi:RNA-directed DNA polymerase
MTKPRYPQGCSAGSQEAGISAESPSDYAWIVNLGNGNANRNNQSNRNHVRAVRAGECHGQFDLRSLYSAWRAARRGKKPSLDQLMFEGDLYGNLLAIQRRLNGLHWWPSAPFAFIAQAPKAREIHAPRFRDRVVHHLLVPQLDRVFEPAFIHDSFSNRTGKGTHAAVARLRQFVREVYSGQGGGYYLQLDIRNFFNSIHRPTLWDALKPRMERAALPTPLLRAVHALLTWPIERTGVHWGCDESQRAAVPPHKRLENAAPGCGIAIGNLSSQFFANVYLDALDQFVKHELRAQRYVRYVDDFVLVHHDREQLKAWRARIADFLRTTLRLELKAEQKLRPLAEGIDFLGYVSFPTHMVPRRRVISHCRAKLAAWEHQHCKRGSVSSCRKAREAARAIWSSYSGHLAHASSFLVRLSIYRRFPWLSEVCAQ